MPCLSKFSRIHPCVCEESLPISQTGSGKGSQSFISEAAEVYRLRTPHLKMAVIRRPPHATFFFKLIIEQDLVRAPPCRESNHTSQKSFPIDVRVPVPHLY